MSPAAETPVKCPICGKPGQASFSPFCSRRCADIDLGRWLKGRYAIPGRPEDDAGTGSEGLPEDGEASES
ncbi:MAG: DNA gyrase inhibitor YacG [Rhizomicrobium sp.]